MWRKKNTQLVREAYLTQIEEHMTEILSLADSCGLGGGGTASNVPPAV